MKIEVIGKESSNRIKLMKNLNKAIEEAKLNLTPKIYNDNYINKYNISNTPALVINDKVISQGKVLTVKEIEKFIKVLN